MRHFVTFIEICVHLIRVNPGHICNVLERVCFVVPDGTDSSLILTY